MSADDAPAYELTRNPVDETWGFICREHGIHRHGLTHQHAINTENKHLREQHADRVASLELDVRELAIQVLRAGEAYASDPKNATASAVLTLWCAITATDLLGGIELAQLIFDKGAPVRAAVVPF